MREAEPLQQVRRTYVRHRGQTLSYFGGCDYFRLASHPKILNAVREGLRRYGLNVAASRMTTGNHEVYVELEEKLARFFAAESALLTSTGYLTNLIVAQALAGQFSHALLDERAHASLQDATEALNCPVLRFKHRDAIDFSHAVARCGKGARLIALTDGMFSHDGSVAPLRAYLKALPADGMLVTDDAHGAGTLGNHGRGSVELEQVSRKRLIQCVTLSKAFGVYGGAVICAKRIRRKLIGSRAFVGSTPLPLPLAYAAQQAIEVLAQTRGFRMRLEQNSAFLKTALQQRRFQLPNTPGPIVALHFGESRQINRVKKALLAARILPPLIHYPGAPANGYFRFVVSSEHTRAQLENLARTLAPFAAAAKC